MIYLTLFDWCFTSYFTTVTTASIMMGEDLVILTTSPETSTVLLSNVSLMESGFYQTETGKMINLTLNSNEHFT